MIRFLPAVLIFQPMLGHNHTPLLENLESMLQAIDFKNE